MSLELKATLLACGGLLALVSSAIAGDLPNSSLTPGVLNLEITQQNIHQTVCVKGYTRTIRPPVSYTNGLKKRQIREYGYQNENPRDYEEDHLIALSIGGHPTDPRNLWPQSRKSEWNAAKKDELEFVLCKMVCSGEISLANAQKAMGGNWITAWEQYVAGHQGRHGSWVGD